MGHEITSTTTDNFQRRIKEVVLNTRHTQNCGTDLPSGGSSGRANSVITGTGVVKGARGAAKFTTSGDQSSALNVGDQVLLYCGEAESAYYHTDSGNNKYGFLEDGTYNQHSKILTVKELANSDNDVVFNEPLPETVTSNTCKLVPVNDVTVYRQLTTQARPNGDWERTILTVTNSNLASMPKMKDTFTWNARIKDCAIEKLDCASVLMGTQGVHVKGKLVLKTAPVMVFVSQSTNYAATILRN